MFRVKRMRLWTLVAAAVLPAVMGTSCLVDLPYGEFVILPGGSHYDHDDDYDVDIYVDDHYHYDEYYYDEYYYDEYYYDDYYFDW